MRSDAGTARKQCGSVPVLQEPVLDYLTRFSGLAAGDLDPSVSRHHLTTAKATYRTRPRPDCVVEFAHFALNPMTSF